MWGRAKRIPPLLFLDLTLKLLKHAYMSIFGVKTFCSIQEIKQLGATSYLNGSNAAQNQLLVISDVNPMIIQDSQNYQDICNLLDNVVTRPAIEKTFSLRTKSR